MDGSRLPASVMAMGFCALAAGDDGQDALEGALPALADQARQAAKTLTGDAAARRSLLEPPSDSRLRHSWPRPSAPLPHLAGLRKLVQVSLLPNWTPSSSGEMAWLDGAEVLEDLSRLSLRVIRSAAGSEDWAVSVASHGARHASEASPRLAPGVAWVALALGDDDEACHHVASIWPQALAKGLLRCLRLRGEVHLESSMLAAWLRKELSGRG
jgi:hypothetical protein